MERTINEIHNLINQKIENARNDLMIIRNYMEKDKTWFEHFLPKFYNLQGEIEAYIDIKTLIETSEVLNNDR